MAGLVRTEAQREAAWQRMIINLAAVATLKQEESAVFTEAHEEDVFVLSQAFQIYDDSLPYLNEETENELLDHLAEYDFYGASS